MITDLRSYQANDSGRIRAEFEDGAMSVLYQLATGGGKTVVFSFIAKAAAALQTRTAILVHRDALLLQASRSLSDCGVPHGIIAPGHSRTRDLVQVASVQTLARRLALHQFDFLVMDEAHHAVAGSWRKIVAAMPSARILGVSATPCRTDGRGLDDIFERMVQGPSIEELIEQNYLVPPVVYAPGRRLDLAQVRTRAGDYDRNQLGAAMDRPKITGDAVEHYLKICPGVPAIVFCVSVQHAQDVAADFQAAGVKAASIHGKMELEEIRAATAGLSSGRVEVLTSCDLISEGFDAPAVGCAILLRPTKSEALYIQQVGRALRPAPGKKEAFILDHADNWTRHGLPDDERAWSLEGQKKRRRGATGPLVRQCPKCFGCHKPAPVCPLCGHVYQAYPRALEQVAGELQRVDAAAFKAKRRELIKNARTLSDLHAVARQLGYKPGWASIVFQRRGGQL